MPANPKLQKIIKLTQSQYNTLSQGGTVGDYTGLDDRYLYLIQDDTDYQPLNSKLTSISNLSSSSTGFIKLTNGVASLDSVITNVKTLKTDNTTAQSTSASESISGSGTINLHKVSKTGSYNDLLNKPTIPTVNNATLTIQNNGTTVNTFTANASSNVTANIQTPTIRRFI